MAANSEPGAPPFPDITTAYPKTALILAQKGLLCDLNEQFTQEELSAYVPGFLQEGKIFGDGLYVFPIAKSTETLFVNTTIFDRFAGETGVSIDDLKTFEGIFHTAALYYDWTDRQTPDIPNDGKMFFMADSLYNFLLIGCKQEAAKILFLSINTIKTHTKRIYMKLDVASRKELLLYVSMLKEIGKDI